MSNLLHIFSKLTGNHKNEGFKSVSSEEIFKGVLEEESKCFRGIETSLKETYGELRKCVSCVDRMVGSVGSSVGDFSCHCGAERDAVLLCYQRNSNKSLECEKVVSAFKECARNIAKQNETSVNDNEAHCEKS